MCERCFVNVCFVFVVVRVVQTLKQDASKYLNYTNYTVQYWIITQMLWNNLIKLYPI